MPADKIAVVTGSNKGVGYHVAQQLIASGEFGTVILGCRDPSRGEAAAKALGGTFEALDIGDAGSIANFAHVLKTKYGRLDCLVNNAAIAYKGSDPTPFVQQTGPTLAINYYGTVALCEALLPLLKGSESARVVNVASMAGKLSQVSPALQRQFASPTLCTSDLNALVAKFETDVAAGRHKQNGWGNSNYGLSKLALIAFTKVLARELPAARVNACCPGYCDTDMSSHRGPRPPAEGAKNAVALVQIADSGVTGAFFQNLQMSKW